MSKRSALIAIAAAWPVGMFLVLLHAEVAAVDVPVLVVLDLAYLGGVLVALRAVNGAAKPVACGLVLAPVVLFLLASFTGEPTAAEPDLLQLNTAALLIVAVALLVLAHLLSDRVGSTPAARVAVLLLGVGTAIYLVNLLSRIAIVLAGAAPLQAAREDTAWVAYKYLTGLEAGAGTDSMSLLLVWTDLLQLGYVACSHACFAVLAVVLVRSGGIGRRVGRSLAILSGGLCAAVLVGAVVAISGPAGVDQVAAWTAYVASIPFMTTVVPFALGVALLAVRVHDRATMESATADMLRPGAPGWVR